MKLSKSNEMCGFVNKEVLIGKLLELGKFLSIFFGTSG